MSRKSIKASTDSTERPGMEEEASLKTKNLNMPIYVRSSLPYIVGITLGFTMYEALRGWSGTLATWRSRRPLSLWRVP